MNTTLRIFLRQVIKTSWIIPLCFSCPLRAETQWQRVKFEGKDNASKKTWEVVPLKGSRSKNIMWEPITPQEDKFEPEQLVWKNSKDKPSDLEQESSSTATGEGLRIYYMLSQLLVQPPQET